MNNKERSEKLLGVLRRHNKGVDDICGDWERSQGKVREEEMECKSKDCNHIKVGDEVKVTDGSWAKWLHGRMLEDIHGIEMDEDIWKVVATDLVLSSRHGFQKKWSPNDTVIYNGYRTVFIRHQFLDVQGASFDKVVCKDQEVRIEGFSGGDVVVKFRRDGEHTHVEIWTRGKNRGYFHIREGKFYFWKKDSSFESDICN